MLLTSALLTLALMPPATGGFAQTIQPKVPQGSTARRSMPVSTEPTEASQDGPNLPGEMTTRILIEREETAHRKILETASQVSDLTSEIHRDYVERGKLTDDDLKKLSTIEKLVKRILEHVGGERVDNNDDTPEETSVASAVEHLSTTGAAIKKNIVANTRFVVQASVIADSNQIIHLAQYIRRAQKAK